MIKVSLYQADLERGVGAIPLRVRATDSLFEKVAAPTLLPDVQRYIDRLKPIDNAQYVLVNALGAGEYWGSNSNADHFEESGLIHCPDTWTGIPEQDRTLAKTWPYGFPTFYNASPFVHHRNHDHGRGLGLVELAAWNPRMKRVELVVRLDKDKCTRFGGTAVWDRIHLGEMPDVSMGSRVCYDLCSRCTDWSLYEKAKKLFDPDRHRYVGEAVLEFHKKLVAEEGRGIRGLSITSKDYCDDMRKMRNRILPDGTKVFVYNPFPRFFDISFVFIGADKTAKTMMKIASEGRVYFFMSGAELAEDFGYGEEAGEEKTAAAKEAEIEKRVFSNQFAAKAVPLLTRSEQDLPTSVLDSMGKDPVKSLSTAGMMGIVLRPREFQRVILVSAGRKDLADTFERGDIVFPKCEEKEDVELSSRSFEQEVLSMLLPFLLARSALAPIIHNRVLFVRAETPGIEKSSSSLSSELLRKIASFYNGYRQSLMELVPSTQDLADRIDPGSSPDLAKIAHLSADQLVSPVTAAYLSSAFYDEVGNGLRGEGTPFSEHAVHN